MCEFSTVMKKKRLKPKPMGGSGFCVSCTSGPASCVTIVFVGTVCPIVCDCRFQLKHGVRQLEVSRACLLGLPHAPARRLRVLRLPVFRCLHSMRKSSTLTWRLNSLCLTRAWILFRRPSLWVSRLSNSKCRLGWQVSTMMLLQEISWRLLFLLCFLGSSVHRLLCQATRFPRCCRWHLGIQPNRSVQRSTPVIITQGAKRQSFPRTGVGLLENGAMRKQQKIWKLQQSSGRGHSGGFKCLVRRGAVPCCRRQTVDPKQFCSHQNGQAIVHTVISESCTSSRPLSWAIHRSRCFRELEDVSLRTDIVMFVRLFHLRTRALFATMAPLFWHCHNLS